MRARRFSVISRTRAPFRNDRMRSTGGSRRDAPWCASAPARRFGVAPALVRTSARPWEVPKRQPQRRR